MIRFIKTLPYPLAPLSGDVFMYLDGITTQRIDPPSLHPGELTIQEPVIFHSPLRRVTDALPAINHEQERIALEELREVPFSLSSLCSPEEWNAEKSAIVRRRFKEAFIADTLTLSRSILEQQTRQALHRIAEHTSAAVVSHSFRLKLLEACINTRGEIFRDPALIHAWISDTEKTYDWGKGFAA